MKQSKYLLYIICVVLFSCASPQKHFQKGNYEKAFTESLKELNKGKKDRKLKTILVKSFNELIKENRAGAERLVSSNQIEDWEVAFNRNENLLDKYDQSSVYLNDSFDPTIEIINNENDYLLKEITNGYMNFGIESMAIYNETGDKLAAQDAFNMYTKVASYNGNSPQLNQLIKEAYEAGVINILVSARSWESRYDWDIDRRFDNLEDESQDFYNIVYERNYENIDCELNIDFGVLDINRQDRIQSENYEERIETGYRTEVDTSGRETRIPIYETVTARVDIIEENYEFVWDVRVDSDRYSNFCDFRNSTFSVNEIVVIENYDWQGDERAVPSRYRNRSRNEISRRDEEEIIEDLIQEAYREIRRQYFNL